MNDNLRADRTTSTDRLFHSPAFVVGFGDVLAGRPFRYPGVAGAERTEKSARLDYERGRQFGVMWRRRPVFGLSAMKRYLQKLRNDGSIT